MSSMFATEIIAGGLLILLAIGVYRAHITKFFIYIGLGYLTIFLHMGSQYLANTSIIEIVNLSIISLLYVTTARNVLTDKEYFYFSLITPFLLFYLLNELIGLTVWIILLHIYIFGIKRVGRTLKKTVYTESILYLLLLSALYIYFRDYLFFMLAAFVGVFYYTALASRYEFLLKMERSLGVHLIRPKYMDEILTLVAKMSLVEGYKHRLIQIENKYYVYLKNRLIELKENIELMDLLKQTRALKDIIWD